MKLLIIEEELNLPETMLTFPGSENSVCLGVHNFHQASGKVTLFNYDVIIQNIALLLLISLGRHFLFRAIVQEFTPLFGIKNLTDELNTPAMNCIALELTQ
jgi:hypothetical protein